MARASVREVASAVALLVLALAGACSRGGDPPARLVDGSRAVPPAVRVAADGWQIVARTRLVPAERVALGSLVGRCVATAHDGAASGDVAVRVGTVGRSVTFRTATAEALVACDASAGQHEGGAPWCGRAFGRLDRRGRLQDPHLDLAGCTSDVGDPVAFAWVEPGPGTSYVAVRQRGYIEVYAVAGVLPIRIATTTGLSLTESSLELEISEHDARGALLRTRRLEASVAG